ncbi:hypothetical protein AB0E64_15920 [Streptomyces caelestis]|uniref:Uncharacterized protein n=2 Tax=Streptomyces caelestis TaxID=36816 RepID=A0A7W9LX64_9ACTN|nr:hypothetical protein [Streptomyces caelestis]MBB5799348.1 hypothetical protein [Streptomyces caelestis]
MAVCHRRAQQGGQGTYRPVRRTVDRVDERFDERSGRPAMWVPDGLMGVSEPRGEL